MHDPHRPRHKIGKDKGAVKMRKWRKRLWRNWRIALAYACSVAMVLMILIVPLGRKPLRGVMVIAPPASRAVAHETQTPPGALTGTAGRIQSLDSLFGRLKRALFRQAFIVCIPWPSVADEAGDDEPLITEVLGAVLPVFGLKPGAPGLLASGIPVAGYDNLELYMTAPRSGSGYGSAEPAVPALTRMPTTTSDVAQWPGGPAVGVYHTHACESFLPELPEANVMRPDDAHTEEMALTVMRLGREIASTLNTVYGIGAVHSSEVHDREGKLGSYIKSEVTVCKILRDYPSVGVMLDIHRDSQPREHTTIEFDGLTYAKVMVVVGTDNPAWKKNEGFARALLGLMQAKYPGISLGVYAKPGRFNQHHSPGLLVLEVGGVENTLEECLRTSRLIAEAVARMVRSGDIPS